MSDDFLVLKITGYSSAERIQDILGSDFVDVAYVSGEDQDGLYVEPDDSIAFDDVESAEWLERCVSETLVRRSEQCQILRMRRRAY
jgi:hypothetical protein